MRRYTTEISEAGKIRIRIFNGDVLYELVRARLVTDGGVEEAAVAVTLVRREDEHLRHAQALLAELDAIVGVERVAAGT